MGQLRMDRPFGIECVRTSIDLRMGEGWEWMVVEYLGSERHLIDSGLTRSVQTAMRAVAEVLDYLAAPDQGPGPF